jgi:hypothetical protein
VNDLIVPQKSFQESPNKSTLCFVCDAVCHFNCQCNESVSSSTIATTAAEAVSSHNCLVFTGDSTCLTCPRHCSRNSHYHSQKVVNHIGRPLREIIGSLVGREVPNSLNSQQTEEVIDSSLSEIVSQLELFCRWVNCLGFSVDLVEALDVIRVELRALSKTHSAASQQSSRKIIQDLTKIMALCASSPDTNNSVLALRTSPPAVKEGKKLSTLREHSNDNEDDQFPPPTLPARAPVLKKKNRRSKT